MITIRASDCLSTDFNFSFTKFFFYGKTIVFAFYTAFFSVIYIYLVSKYVSKLTVRCRENLLSG